MFKRLLLTLLTLTMLFVFTACGMEMTNSNVEDQNFVSESIVASSNESDDKQSSVAENISSEESVVESTEQNSSVESTVTSTPSKVQSSTQNSQTVTVPSQQETVGNLVWVPTHGGKKYHSKSSCSGMKEPMQVTKETAESNGFGPCGRCY